MPLHAASPTLSVRLRPPSSVRMAALSNPGWKLCGLILPPASGLSAFVLQAGGLRKLQGSAHLGWEAFGRWRPGLQVWGWCSAAPYWPRAALDTDGRPCPKPSVAGGTTLSTINPRSTHLANETKGLMRPEKWNPQAGYLVFCMNS